MLMMLAVWKRGSYWGPVREGAADAHDAGCLGSNLATAGAGEAQDSCLKVGRELALRLMLVFARRLAYKHKTRKTVQFRS